jgi:hypothetical protein
MSLSKHNTILLMKYLKLNSEAVSAYSNVKKPICLTSGCPKNQKRCWNNIGSPPPAASKKDVLKFLSVKTIVIPIFFIYLLDKIP